MEKTLAEIETKVASLEVSLALYTRLAGEHEAAGNAPIAAKLHEVIGDLQRDIRALQTLIGDKKPSPDDQITKVARLPHGVTGINRPRDVLD